MPTFCPIEIQDEIESYLSKMIINILQNNEIIKQITKKYRKLINPEYGLSETFDKSERCCTIKKNGRENLLLIYQEKDKSPELYLDDKYNGGEKIKTENIKLPKLF